MLNQKQNLLRMLDGQMPEYVPVNSRLDRSKPPLWAGAMMFNPSILGDFRGPNGGYDPWGVHYTVESSAGSVASIPEPGNFILKDVTRWEEVIKVPEHFKNWDWERAAKADMAKLTWDPEQSIFVGKGWDDFFQQFIGMMGFTEGLCALHEEPEAVHALLDFMCDTVIDITKNVLYYYKPEAYYLLDDSASKYTPFVGREMFDEFFVPRYKRTLDLVRDAGLPVLYHNCGRCEDLLPSMVRLGVRVWDPAQVENNLVEVKTVSAVSLSSTAALSSGPTTPTRSPRRRPGRLSASASTGWPPTAAGYSPAWPTPWSSTIPKSSRSTPGSLTRPPSSALPSTSNRKHPCAHKNPPAARRISGLRVIRRQRCS